MPFAFYMTYITQLSVIFQPSSKMHKLQACAAVLTICFQLGKSRDFSGVQGDYEFGKDFSPFEPFTTATDDVPIACSGCIKPTDSSPIVRKFLRKQKLLDMLYVIRNVTFALSRST